MTARRNIEFKARLGDFAQARRIAGEVATSRLADERQTDTYFRVRHGRLKLREIEEGAAWLIAYDRADRHAARASDYRLIAITAAAELKAALADTLGVLVVVAKLREIYLVDNVRIHLDQVLGLGEFLEFEAVLAGDTDAAGHAQLSNLRRRFEPVVGEPIATSYSDLLLAQPSWKAQP